MIVSFKEILAKSSQGFSRILRREEKENKISTEFLQELEDTLVLADVGVELASSLIKEIRRKWNSQKITTKEEAKEMLVQALIDTVNLPKPESLLYEDKLNVYLFAGVNGVGKTTILAKFAHRLMKAGVRVISACADTFRAAAAEQLTILGKQVGFPVVAGERNVEPASVVFHGFERAVSEGYSALLIDTAGRMQTKKNLMDELGKISRASRKALSKMDVDEKKINEMNFLVLDGTTGQNAIAQAKVFSEAVALTGIILNKIDGTAKGGVIFPVVEATRLPVLFLGCGEEIEDILEFDAIEFVRNLLGV